MALCAQDLMQQGKLPGNILVATVMSNMALEVFMKERGGTLIRTNVGDRHVVGGHAPARGPSWRGTVRPSHFP